MITLDQLNSIYKEGSTLRNALFLPFLNQAAIEADLTTPQRLQMFLAQVGHESGQLRYVEELASGQAYEGRADLGNSHPGDGVKYKGRGLIQVTGRDNYIACGLALDLPLLDSPELLKQPENAARSAAWFWNYKQLNSYCDKGDFIGLTKRINGGTNGLADRQMLYDRAVQAIKKGP